MSIQATKFTALLVASGLLLTSTAGNRLWEMVSPPLAIAMPSPVLALRLSQGEAKPRAYDQHSQELAVGNGVASFSDSHALRVEEASETNVLTDLAETIRRVARKAGLTPAGITAPATPAAPVTRRTAVPMPSVSTVAAGLEEPRLIQVDLTQVQGLDTSRITNDPDVVKIKDASQIEIVFREDRNSFLVLTTQQMKTNVMAILKHLKLPHSTYVVNVGSWLRPLKLPQPWRPALNLDPEPRTQEVSEWIGAEHLPYDMKVAIDKWIFDPKRPETLADVVLLHNMEEFLDSEFLQGAWAIVRPGGWLLLMRQPIAAKGSSLLENYYRDFRRAIGSEVPAAVQLFGPDPLMEAALAIAVQKAAAGLEEMRQILIVADTLSETAEQYEELTMGKLKSWSRSNPQVDLATKADEAIRMFQTGAYDAVILLDLRFGGGASEQISGLDLLNAITESGQPRAVIAVYAPEVRSHERALNWLFLAERLQIYTERPLLREGEEDFLFDEEILKPLDVEFRRTIPKRRIAGESNPTAGLEEGSPEELVAASEELLFISVEPLYQGLDRAGADSKGVVDPQVWRDLWMPGSLQAAFLRMDLAKRAFASGEAEEGVQHLGVALGMLGDIRGTPGFAEADPQRQDQMVQKIRPMFVELLRLLRKLDLKNWPEVLDEQYVTRILSRLTQFERIERVEFGAMQDLILELEDKYVQASQGQPARHRQQPHFQYRRVTVGETPTDWRGVPPYRSDKMIGKLREELFEAGKDQEFVLAIHKQRETAEPMFYLEGMFRPRVPPAAAGLEEVVQTFRQSVDELASEVRNLGSITGVVDLAATSIGAKLQGMAEEADLEPAGIYAVSTASLPAAPPQTTLKLHVPQQWQKLVGDNFPADSGYEFVDQAEEAHIVVVEADTPGRETLILEGKILLEVASDKDAESITPGLLNRLAKQGLFAPGLGTLIVIQSLTAPEFRDVVLIFA